MTPRIGDELRERWDHPRRRFASVDTIVDELHAIARDALAVDHANPDAPSELAFRATMVGGEREDFAMDLAEHGDDLPDTS